MSKAKLTSRLKEETETLFRLSEDHLLTTTSPFDMQSEMPHKCSLSCLGPLAFHSQVRGRGIRLSQGGLLAERKESTFKNGLLFSSREVKPMEKIRLRVMKESCNWQGALRIGFTNVPPSSRSLPLPQLAIPDMTDTPGHWANPLLESLCSEGSELEFWFTSKGSIYVTGNNCMKHELYSGMDMDQPLWAMIDLYGNTRSIFLLGSNKFSWFLQKTSCPTPEPLTKATLNRQSMLVSQVLHCDGNLNDEDLLTNCVVCMDRCGEVTLPCHHRCLCKCCYLRVLEDFGCCPLCRHSI